MKKYYKRHVEKIIERKMKSSGAILVAGPKFCGKTTTCSLFAKSIYRINTKLDKHCDDNKNESSNRSIW